MVEQLTSALSGRLMNTLGWTLLVLEVLNVGADALSESYQSNGTVNFAFSALITAVFTERSLRARDQSGARVDDERRDPDGIDPGNSGRLRPRRSMAPRQKLSQAEVALVVATFVISVLGGLYYWQQGKDEAQVDKTQADTIMRLDQLTTENAALIEKLDTALACVDEASAVAAENLRRRSAPSAVASDATRKLISAFGKLGQASTPEEQAANRAISAQLFADFDRTQADADAAREANPLLPFPDCKAGPTAAPRAP